jgi:heme exporter protein CcmD
MVVVLLIAWVWLDHRAQRRKLDELEARGITRRSTGTSA